MSTKTLEREGAVEWLLDCMEPDTGERAAVKAARKKDKVRQGLAQRCAAVCLGLLIPLTPLTAGTSVVDRLTHANVGTVGSTLDKEHYQHQQAMAGMYTPEFLGQAHTIQDLQHIRGEASAVHSMTEDMMTIEEGLLGAAGLAVTVAAGQTTWRRRRQIWQGVRRAAGAATGAVHAAWRKLEDPLPADPAHDVADELITATDYIAPVLPRAGTAGPLSAAAELPLGGGPSGLDKRLAIGF